MRFAIVGCGDAGARRAAALDAIEDADLAVCVDVSMDRAEELAARYGADASTDWRTAVSRPDVDAVIVSTSNNLHSSIAIGSAESRKHVLCERPLARNPSEAERMVASAREYDVRLKTGFTLRYQPAVIRARGLVDSGRIGKVISVRARSGRGSYITRSAQWLVDPELSGGGTLLDNGIDLLDLCRVFMGDFRRVFGHVATLVWPVELIEDNAFAILSTSDGRAALVQSSWSDWQGYIYMEISGTDGYINLNVDESTLVVGMRPGMPGAGLEEVIDLSIEPDRSIILEMEDFINSIREHREPKSSGLDGYEALVLAHAIYRSSTEGTAVKV